MEKTNTVREKMLRSVSEFRLPRYAEIADVGLYLEQTVRLINAYLAPLAGIEITASMISNYVKQGLISHPVKKQYSAEHIAKLIFIAVSKTVLTIDDIRLLLGMQTRSYDTALAYDYFCRELEGMIDCVFGKNGGAEIAGTTEYDERSILRNTTIALAHKIYLDLYLKVVREGDVSALPS